MSVEMLVGALLAFVVGFILGKANGYRTGVNHPYRRRV